MLIVVIAGGEDQKEFQDKQLPEGAIVQFVATIDEAKPGAEAYFYLLNEDQLLSDLEKIKQMQVPVFLKPVSIQQEKLPNNAVRLSEWQGFLFETTLSIDLHVSNADAATKVLQHLKWKFEPNIRA